MSWVETRGFEPLTPSMRTRCATGLRHVPGKPDTADPGPISRTAEKVSRYSPPDANPPRGSALPRPAQAPVNRPTAPANGRQRESGGAGVGGAGVVGPAAYARRWALHGHAPR